MVTLFDNAYTGLNEHRFTVHEIVVGFGLTLWDPTRPYPIFDEDYREELNAKIFDHFEYRRIAASTPQLFVYYLNRRMREQMPTFNKIYEHLLTETDPFLTHYTDTSGENASAGHSASEVKADALSNAKGRNITSNTPASFLEQADEPKYMSGLVQNESGSTSNSTSNDSSDSTTNSNYIGRIRGRTGYLGDSILSALATGFLNTDLMVCDMLEPLFMQLWDDQPL